MTDRAFRSVGRLWFLLLCLAVTGLWGQSAQAQWSVSWSDEFNGSANSAPDSSKWIYFVGVPSGQGAVGYATNSRDNSYMDGTGNLVIQLLYNANGFTQYPGSPKYTTAHLETDGKFAAGPYGKLEARIKTAYAPGIGQAFWAMGNDHLTDSVPWPWCGELDIMEITYPTPGHNGWTLHGGETDGQTYFEYGGISATADLPSGQQFSQAFHTFGVQWAPYHLQYFLDGNQVGEVYQSNIGAAQVWPMEKSYFLILSAGVGAGNSGTPTGAGFPQKLTADYVRYYKWAAGAPAAPTGLTATSSNSNATTLSWTASSTAGAAYNIYASTSATFTADTSTLVVQNVTGTSYTHVGLANSTTYHYQVKAADWGGESAAATTQVTTRSLGSSTDVKLSAGGYGVGNFMSSHYELSGPTNYSLNAIIDTSAVPNPPPTQIYRVERWGACAWTITDLNPGSLYRVRVHMVELAKTGANQRAFNLMINSQTVLSNFDIYAAAGGANKAIVREFDTHANEFGIIEIQGQYGTSTVSGISLQPSIRAIEVNAIASSSNLVGAAPGTATSLKINCGGPAVSPFVADTGFLGGSTAVATNTISTGGVTNPAPAAVYQSHRYVPHTYVLSKLAARATYNVRLHFAETYWTASGQRVFHVNLNGKRVLTNFDIYAAAGGQNKAVVREFSTQADMYGQIILEFLYGGFDQPLVSGIEAIQTAPPATPTATVGATPTATATATATATPRSTATGATPTTAPPTPTATAGPTPTSSGGNLALNRPATASSIEGANYPASKAVDGNTTTRWSSAHSDPQWIYVDLGATHAISRVVLNWQSSYAKAFQLQTSNDAASWSNIYSTTTSAGGLQNLTVSGSGRYVRMYGTMRSGSYGYSLWELEVY
jgi:beta-glucanase (GH16 family)